ncbi:transient receptor potential cation channel trpm [Caerostris extrusa]|uniref:Transient receptor potential cation channel trpm n=1 Tax=Caerostris extrusa TaxID=172846 RepID=A0AAV4P7N7_CAEEX|nr:transient receptor potential cation channel trpm [Caerostris extrusa]
MSSICDESEPSDEDPDERVQRLPLRNSEAPKIVEPTNEANFLEDHTTIKKSPSSSKVQFNEQRDSITSKSSLTPQMSSQDSIDRQSVFIGGRHQRRLSRTAIDRLGLMRQSTVPTRDTFNVQSTESDVVSEPILTRGSSVSQMEDTISSLIPAKQPVERSASVAVGGPMREKKHHQHQRMQSLSTRRPRSTSPLTHTFGPSFATSFSRQNSAEYQTLLSVESENLHAAEEADYHMMEGLIKRRLHRDSENLTVSLEELCSVKGESDSETEDNERRQFCTVRCENLPEGISPSPSAPNVTIDPASDSSPDEHIPKSQSANSIQTLKFQVKGNETSC